MLDFIVFINAFVSCVSLQFSVVDLLVNFLGLLVHLSVIVFTLSMFMLFCISVYYSATFSVLV